VVAAPLADPESPAWFARPDHFEVLARLRREAPVTRYAPHAWTVASYEHVREVSRDPQRFSSARGVLVQDPVRHGGDIAGSILHMDPPEHGAWRRLVSRRFTPRAVATMEPDVRAAARATLDAAPAEPFDFVQHVASPFPVAVIADLLGIDRADRDDFRRWSDAAISTPDEPEAALADLGELTHLLIEQVRDRRRSPRDDLTTELAHAQVEGRPLSTREAVTYVLSLLVAGNETTRHLVSGAVFELGCHPGQRALLVEDHGRLPEAVEEALRWVTPIQAFGRTVTGDTVLGGCDIPAGDFVVMLYASANRDEAVFGPDAGCFDVTRPVEAPHVAFGFGEHLCLGAALARLEARVLLEEWLERAPGYRITAPPSWVRSTLVRGLATLPLAPR
jgi:cytochrome P450